MILLPLIVIVGIACTPHISSARRPPGREAAQLPSDLGVGAGPACGAAVAERGPAQAAHGNRADRRKRALRQCGPAAALRAGLCAAASLPPAGRFTGQDGEGVRSSGGHV